MLPYLLPQTQSTPSWHKLMLITSNLVGMEVVFRTLTRGYNSVSL